MPRFGSWEGTWQEWVESQADAARKLPNRDERLLFMLEVNAHLVAAQCDRQEALARNVESLAESVGEIAHIVKHGKG